MQGEKVHSPGTKENADAPGAKAPPLWRPGCDNVVLPGPALLRVQGNRMRPRPQWGQGWRKGEQMTVGVQSPGPDENVTLILYAVREM
jgi:hypothetical protein